uniref:Major allergen I polypeptide chain 1-like isoform X2 n=1 Tax=Callorhinus ursinus TaxID=34884 RepID=A0A3Q7P4A4_CALUR|nr:major allergen I polypeptide chain 1-like isoform X2 [Callorhinus ursinus]
MKLAGTLELLWAASLLLSGRDCKICSAVSDDVTLFLTGTTEAYVQEVAQYQNESIILENAKSLKECVDGKMTADDKTNAVNVLSGNKLRLQAASVQGAAGGSRAGDPQVHLEPRQDLLSRLFPFYPRMPPIPLQ